MSDAKPHHRYQHKATGGVYTLLEGYALLQTTVPLVNGDPVAICQGKSGRIFARRQADFDDGRFERVADAEAPVRSPYTLPIDREAVARAIFGAITFLDPNAFHPAFEHDKHIWFAAADAVSALDCTSEPAPAPGAQPSDRTSSADKVWTLAELDQALGPDGKGPSPELASALAAGYRKASTSASDSVARSMDRERIATLEDALRPFAKAGELFGQRVSDEFDLAVYSPVAGRQFWLSGDDMRRARDALRSDTPFPDASHSRQEPDNG